MIGHLKNFHPGSEFGDLSIFGVYRGRFESGLYDPYLFSNSPIAAHVVSDTTRTGFVAEYRLSQCGELMLAMLRDLLSEEAETRVDEVLCGDFFLDMRSHFSCVSTFVPFVNGLVSDRAVWQTEAGQHIPATPSNIDRRYRVGQLRSAKILRQLKQGYLVQLEDELLPINAFLREYSRAAPTDPSHPLPENILCEVASVSPAEYRIEVGFVSSQGFSDQNP